MADPFTAMENALKESLASMEGLVMAGFFINHRSLPPTTRRTHTLNTTAVLNFCGGCQLRAPNVPLEEL